METDHKSQITFKNHTVLLNRKRNQIDSFTVLKKSVVSRLLL